MEMPSTVDIDEPLARFLTQSYHYSHEKGVVKPAAFEPPRDLHLSVFRIDGLVITDVWRIGKQQVTEKMKSPAKLYGFADIKASTIQDSNLRIESDNDPPRHASVVGWPEEKSKRKLIAIELASRSQLVLHP